MLALLSTVLFAIGRAQYEECVAATSITGSGGQQQLAADVVTAAIKRQTSDNTIQIILTGPTGGYFGVGFGGTLMAGTYAITVEGASTATERSLTGPPGSRGGSAVSTASATDTQFSDNNGIRTVTITRPYASDGTFDFTSLMDCTASSIDVIAAANTGSLTFGYHSSGKAEGTLTRTCSCASNADTPSSSPTKQPSNNPTTTPSKQPTGSPNNDPTTSPTTNPSNMPTTNPSNMPTASPVASSGSGYEACVASTEIKSGISISIGRKISDETMEIVMTGPVSAWFSFGFGKKVMEDSYAITIDGATAVERTLGNQKGGDVVSNPSLTSTTFDDDGTTRTATLVRPWTSDGTYDFSVLLCDGGSIDAISAQGGSTTFGYHSGGKAIGSLTSTCTDSCPTATTTQAATTINPAGGNAHNIFNAIYICLAVCISFYFIA